MPFQSPRKQIIRVLPCMLAIALVAGCGAKQERRAEDTASHETDFAVDTFQADDQSPVASEPDTAFEPELAMETTAPMTERTAAPMIVSRDPVLAVPRASGVSEPKSEMAMEAMSAPRSAVRSASQSPTVLPKAAPKPTEDPSERIAASTGPFTSLPAGSTHDADKGFATVAVYYATDRQRNAMPLSAYNVTGNRDAFLLLGMCATVLFVMAGFNIWRQQTQAGLGFGIFGCVAAAAATIILMSGAANIEKKGVSYNGARGTLVKGICEVTVPDTHERGVVERPSLLRFEVRENQQDHIVLTSAIELSDNDFQRRLADTVALSPNQDLLVFIHGYNVDFESAVQRTAQIAVDLPFEGVPVCYSWPSQGDLFGYTVDETNSAWTQTHLKQFLLDLAKSSGAQSINVVAHSMGNRPTAGAMVEIGWEYRQNKSSTAPNATTKPFDRLVMAAPDVDADRFRRDLAPVLTQVADHVTLYASSDDQALIASKQVHGYPRAGESGPGIVVVPGIETVDVSGIDLSLLGHSYYGDNQSMLHDLYQVVRNRLPATSRQQLSAKLHGDLMYWQLMQSAAQRRRVSAEPTSVR